MSPPRPHLFARSAVAERANGAIAGMWARGWTEKPRLDPDFLWEEGAKGFSAEDEISIRSEEEVADFRLRLEKLCQALTGEAQLNALGHTMAYGQLKGAIRKRHALGRLWREKPDLATATIAAPILVLGQMRSGTTRVQRLLAADPRFCGTRFCDSHDPVPSRPDLRPLKARAGLFLARSVNPWLETMHPFGSIRTDEEIGWLAAALSPAAYEAQWHIPSFVAFSEDRSAAPIYREFSRILRTDAARHGNGSRPRVLKCPQFSEDLPELIGQFPDARIVLCERDRKAVLASSVSMVASQRAFQSDSHSEVDLRGEWERKIDLRDTRMTAALDEAHIPVPRVCFRRLNDQPHHVLDSVYRDLGLGYDRIARTAAEGELARAEKGHHRKHRTQIARLAPALHETSG